MPDGDTTIERWLPVGGWEGLYEVSDHGHVRSLTREVSHGTKRARMHLRGRILKLHDLSKDRQRQDGYKKVLLCRDGRCLNASVHRLVLEAFVGPCPVGLQCRHLDGHPSNNVVGNLRWGTAKENSADRVAQGTQVRGRQVSGARLTEEQVREIRTSADHSSILERRYGVSRYAVYAIRRRLTWRWLE